MSAIAYRAIWAHDNLDVAGVFEDFVWTTGDLLERAAEPLALESPQPGATATPPHPLERSTGAGSAQAEVEAVFVSGSFPQPAPLLIESLAVASPSVGAGSPQVTADESPGLPPERVW
jgi:hypothetical protein